MFCGLVVVTEVESGRVVGVGWGGEGGAAVLAGVVGGFPELDVAPLAKSVATSRLLEDGCLYVALVAVFFCLFSVYPYPWHYYLPLLILSVLIFYFDRLRPFPHR